MRITYSPRPFEFSHGRKPRGRGLWAFRVCYTDATGQRQQSPDVFFDGLFSAARRAALVHARELAANAGATALTLEALP